MRGSRVITIIRRRTPISGVATQPVYAAGPMSENSVNSFDSWLSDNTDYYVDEIIDICSVDEIIDICSVDEIIDICSVSDAKDYLAG